MNESIIRRDIPIGTCRDLTGDRFERLFVISYVGRAPSSRACVFLCRCDCGKERIATDACLLAGKTNSCGCLRAERSSKFWFSEEGHEKIRQRLVTHDASTTPTYKTWTKMLRRCFNPNHATFKKYYGGIGVSVAPRWRKFENFLADLGPKPEGTTLGRILDYGSYAPGNAFWQTREEQLFQQHLKRIINGTARCP